MSAVSQVWQTPVRQDHLTATSHASASSSKLWYFASQGNVSPLRAKETCGPEPAGSAGKCGECVSAFIPGELEFERAENLRMNMIGSHAPRPQAGGDLPQKSRGAAQIELAVMRNANLVECRNSEVPGRVEIDTASVGRSRPAILNVAPAVG